jgi:hypothetical protein
MKKLMRASLVAAATVLCANAHATLGGNAASVAQDGSSNLTIPAARQMAQAATGAAQATFSVQTVQSGRIAVSEYVSTATNAVFAIRFAGPYLPDLAQLTGTYFPALQAAMAKIGPRVPVRDISTPTLVLHEQGFMGSFTGYVYDPTLTPVGFDSSILAN